MITEHDVVVARATSAKPIVYGVEKVDGEEATTVIFSTLFHNSTSYTTPKSSLAHHLKTIRSSTISSRLLVT